MELLPLLSQLKELNLGINPKIGNEGAILIANAIKELDGGNSSTIKLETLSLFSCNIGQDGADALLSIFPNNTSIKYLSIDDVTTTKKGSSSGIRSETIDALRTATMANWND